MSAITSPTTSFGMCVRYCWRLYYGGSCPVLKNRDCFFRGVSWCCDGDRNMVLGGVGRAVVPWCGCCTISIHDPSRFVLFITILSLHPDPPTQMSPLLTRQKFSYSILLPLDRQMYNNLGLSISSRSRTYPVDIFQRRQT